MLLILGFAVGTYLIGSVSFAVIVSKFYHMDDPRSYGSGNPGATNVLRSGKKTAAALTLIGDMLKGMIAITITMLLQQELNLNNIVIAVAAVAVVVGHMWPIFYKFKGGKGVATAFGVLAILSWEIALICAVMWLIIAIGFKLSSLAGLIAILSAPILSYLFKITPSWNVSILVISLLVTYRHKNNIINLINGQESRIGGNKS